MDRTKVILAVAFTVAMLAVAMPLFGALLWDPVNSHGAAIVARDIDLRHFYTTWWRHGVTAEEGWLARQTLQRHAFTTGLYLNFIAAAACTIMLVATAIRKCAQLVSHDEPAFIDAVQGTP